MENLESNFSAKHSSSELAAEVPRCDISLVIPCYNELDGIENTINRVVKYCSETFSDLTFEVVIADDGSTDGTRTLLSEIAIDDSRVRPVYLGCNRGRGAAVREGIRNSTGRWVITLDADLSYDVDHIGEIISQFKKEPRADVVVVSPYMKGGVVKGVPAFRLFLSKTANWLLSGFFSARLSTVTCVVRGYRGPMVRSVPLFEKGKEFHLEILRKLAICGAGIVEIPGRLIWKEQKKRAKRLNKKGLAMAAANHILYGLLIKPTRVFKYLTPLLFLVAAICSLVVFVQIWDVVIQSSNFSLSGFTSAVKEVYDHSTVLFITASVAMILGVQFFSFLAILQVMRLQQEELMRHVMALLEGRRPAFQES